MPTFEKPDTRTLDVTWLLCGGADEPAAIVYGLHRSPFGPVVIGLAGRDLCYLSFADGDDAERELGERWPAATMVRDDAATAAAFRAVFHDARTGTGRPLRLRVFGTAFQIRVWQALLDVAPGTVTTYARLAADAGRPKAVRAAGTACGKNPVAYVIPCHRVVATDGGIGGYAWGTTKKEAILASEGALAFAK